MSKRKVHDISDSDETDCDESENAAKNSDSDCTVDSVELNELIKANKQKTSPVKAELVACKYGSDCIRKNPEHFLKYCHPSKKNSPKSKINSSPKRFKKELTRPGYSADNYSDYGFYLTKVKGIASKHDFLSLHISDILSMNHEELISSAQFNYMIDIPWLVKQYPTSCRSKKVLIVHGEKDRSEAALHRSASSFSNVSFCRAKLDIPFGTHHTKMMLLQYASGLRVVIHTANLIENDWHQKTQGIWMSPICPVKENQTSKSVPGFHHDLIQYLERYRAKELKPWIDLLQKHDMSSIKVQLIGSIPGRHIGSEKYTFGHLKLRQILKKLGPDRNLVTVKWPVIGQFSSIGSLGKDASQWLCAEWLASLSSVKDLNPIPQNIPLQLIFPSVDDVRLSLEGYPAGASLPYNKETAARQPYLNKYLSRWKSDFRGRTICAPHIKTYMRASADGKQISWFLVTSANLSKAAWGVLEKKQTQLMIRSYELGVLFLPSAFSKDTFLVMDDESQTSHFPLPVDLPLKPYSSTDKPWTWNDVHREKPDRNGNMWCPS